MTFSFVCISLQARENVFCGWFDIQKGSPAGTEVTGRIHIERNKNVRNYPIPEEWHFELEDNSSAPFSIETRFDPSGRIMGVLSSTERLSSKPVTYDLTGVLKAGDDVMEKFSFQIHVVDETLLSIFYRRYFPKTLSEGRLYGSKKLSDNKAESLIQELESNDGRFPGYSCYDQGPVEFAASHRGKSVSNEWAKVAESLGWLGYVYSTSEKYGPDGDPKQHERLKTVLFRAIKTYVDCVTIYGDEVVVDGKPVGDGVGDGFSLLASHGLLSHSDGTHHWRFTDPMIVPCLSLVPDLLEGEKKGDADCLALHDSLVRYFQLFTSIVEVRRVIDNPSERWGALVDTTYSSGAWADANLGHRSRTMLALPLIWGDYNRPMTYVPYWYEEYYGGKPFEGFSFSTGWSPHGVLFDVNRWMTKYGIPSHHYVQSGFHPDGTISHHVGHGTDAAMVAYGFEWLTDCSAGFSYFKDTPFQLDSKYYQFQLDRLIDVYPAFFYKGSMDYLIAGRSHLSDMNKFVSKTYCNAVRALEEACGKTTRLERMDSLKILSSNLKKGKFETSLTRAYWVNEFLIHRRNNYYASVKLKSERTVGIEDFSKVRHSWHGGSGILNVKVDGSEYDHKVLSSMDWHALPGLTEEWRTDPLPAEGGSQAALPGSNKIAGVLSDGVHGLAIYHHLPQETYSSATALKTYHFLDRYIAAAGSSIGRYRVGQGQAITTFVDQSRFDSPLSYCVNGRLKTIRPGEDKAVDIVLSAPAWLHHDNKAYVIVPSSKIGLSLRTGSKINVTDPAIASEKNYIIGLSHEGKYDDRYLYFIIPDIEAGEVDEAMHQILDDARFSVEADSVHTFHSKDEHLYQWAFFEGADGAWCGDVKASSDAPSMLMMKEMKNSWIVSIGNPSPDGVKKRLDILVSERLKPGSYTYETAGVKALEGEQVIVTETDAGSLLVVELPDRDDEERYNHQSDLYAASPVVVEIPKK